ncbi:BMP family ABC transporter substrate-binding protein [Anaerotruncus sp. X29]|nr:MULTISPECIES: BMP family ABC transporter substrate-binding protein [unclassified Anaerotruncus]MCI9236580.1 BMP family ABC transporter substrate-binding protein [Anaerotruncus sp.]NBK17532.1 BMP family ABC transporter substrate-binding protein [Anaerotruncus sp. 1XD42-93]NCE73574.1 BMP family ABC transporter substrate-binding protein [Anaerotruncus sp. X29]RKJ97585.1 BMP family ABC transporter substrate-binding protein [Anaerotruncus sp. 1XD22-93]
MKRILASLLAVSMLAFASGCGGSSSAPASSAPASSAPASSEAPAQSQSAESTPAPSEVASATPERSEGSAWFGASSDPLPAIAVEDLKVGVIHITDPAEGSGYTYTHDQGIVGMQENIGLKPEQIIRKNNVNDQDASAIETAILECIEEGCQVIFATSWGYMDTCEAIAEEYPEVILSHGTGYKSNGANFNNYFGRIYQARYLTGIAAGLKTKTNKIGYVAAQNSENSEVTGGCDAFAMGVYSVNPDAEVYVKVTGSWFDPEGEKQAAEALIAEGCDVIGQHCDTPNPQLAAEEKGVWGVGYNSDMSKDAPKAVLTSTVWDWSAYYTAAVQRVIAGEWNGQNYFGGMADGLVAYSPLSDLCEEGTAEAIDAVQQKIMSGEWDVFTGPIEDNQGNVVCAEGEKLDDATITGGINWYFKNVTVK